MAVCCYKKYLSLNCCFVKRCKVWGRIIIIGIEVINYNIDLFEGLFGLGVSHVLQLYCASHLVLLDLVELILQTFSLPDTFSNYIVSR